jgi:hypothetical protein
MPAPVVHAILTRTAAVACVIVGAAAASPGCAQTSPAASREADGGPVSSTAAAPATTPILFLVAETTPVHGDSYVLPLTDTLDVAHARALLAQGPASGVGSIVTAHIAAGADSVNRDYRASGNPPWSWHVTQFDGFADMAIELCDGWPGYVEQDVNGWIANTGGSICFWTYTVVQELGPLPTRETTWGTIKGQYR